MIKLKQNKKTVHPYIHNSVSEDCNSSITLTPLENLNDSSKRQSLNPTNGSSRSSSDNETADNNGELKNKESFRERKEYYKKIEKQFKDNPVTAKLAKGFFFDTADFNFSSDSKRSLRGNSITVKKESTEEVLSTKSISQVVKSPKKRFINKEQQAKYDTLNKLKKHDLIKAIIEKEEKEKLTATQIVNLTKQLELQKMESGKSSTNNQTSKYKLRTLELTRLSLEIEVKKAELNFIEPCNNEYVHVEKMGQVHSLILTLNSLISDIKKEYKETALKTTNKTKTTKLNKPLLGVKRGLSRESNLTNVKKKLKINKTVKAKVAENVKVKHEMDIIDDDYANYLAETKEIFETKKALDVFKQNPFFVKKLKKTCEFLKKPQTILHFSDTLVEKDKNFAPGEHSFIDLIISPLWPTLKERYVILGNPEIKAINGFQIDSLREIYDLLQLNNYIFFKEKEELINNLIFDFYKNLVKRKNNAKYDFRNVSIFEKLINQWNDFVTSNVYSSKELLKNASEVYLNKKLPLFFMKYISNYTYGRTILPNAKKLTKYKGFSDKTYGELMSDFLILAFDKCGMNSKTKYVDLGSGIGNTNFFASLAYNVESSFGCEIMQNPSELCVLYQNYFVKMLEVFGINNHTSLSFDLEKSFMDNDIVKEKLKSCDILLLNNFIFSPVINIEVTKLVSYLPPGAKIIHLKPLQTLEKQNTLRRRKEQINYNENSIDSIEFFGQNSTKALSESSADNEENNKIFDNIRDYKGKERILITSKYQMPCGDMVSWTTNNDQYNYFITEIST
ncbi:hypothetical protein QEN19_000910 [Hanseniaspora menglaensis]